MPTLHLFNPNTTALVTERMVQVIEPRLQPGLKLQAYTATFGAPYISDEASYAIAGHACVAWMQSLLDHEAIKPEDRVLIGCFGDPGLFALREMAPCPVTGLASASFELASRYGAFGIVTGGQRWPAMLTRLAQALHMDSKLEQIEAIEATGAQLAADRKAAIKLLTIACQQLQDRCREAGRPLEAIVLGGAGLAGYAADIASSLHVPLIDSVQAGVEVAR
jgi:Asp/Glu/hydantoin racemase